MYPQVIQLETRRHELVREIQLSRERRQMRASTADDGVGARRTVTRVKVLDAIRARRACAESSAS